MSDSELNGNVTIDCDEGNTVDCSMAGSMEDLSEYTDADQSISAPTEILAEFLSSIMMKDYEKALKYCALILHYEPNNLTAREFYPLIEEKLEMKENRKKSLLSDVEIKSFLKGNNYINEMVDFKISSMTDMLFVRREELEDSDSANSVDCSSTSSSSSFENDSDGTTASYSSLEDDEADVENNDIANGNINHIDTGISSNLKQENKHMGSEEKKVPETKPHVKVQNKTSPKKWVLSASPTITKIDNTVDLTQTRTHTKRFQTYLDNKPSLNNPKLPIKTSKISDIKNSQRSKISDKR